MILPERSLPVRAGRWLDFHRRRQVRAARRWVAHEDISAYEADHAPRAGGRFGEMFLAHEGQVAHKWDHYLPIYEQLLGGYAKGFVDDTGSVRPLRFLEIGVSEGGSLEVWRKYLGPDAVIHGLDIDPRCAHVVPALIARVHIGSQDDVELLRRVVEEMGGVDVVLDDGSHVANHQRISFDALWPLLSFGGMYICEDLHTAYWPGYQGGLRRPGQFISVAKALVDGMHRWYARMPDTDLHRYGQREVGAVHFYDSIVAIEKTCRVSPTWSKRGTGTKEERAAAAGFVG